MPKPINIVSTPCPGATNMITPKMIRTPPSKFFAMSQSHTFGEPLFPGRCSRRR